MTPMFYMFLMEFVSSLITPSLFFCNYSVNTYNSTVQVSVDYSINAILQLANVGKFAHQLLEVFSSLKYNNLSIQRISQLAGTKTSWFTPLKNFITNESSQFMIYSFLLSMFLFSGSALILERPVALLSGNNFTKWEESLWFAIITMMTVGYGDVRPTSTSGKLLIMIIVVWGNFWSSIMLTTVVPLVQLSIQEEKAHNLQKRLMKKEQIHELSAKIITQLFKFNSVMGKQPAQNFLQMLSTKTFTAISELRFAQKSYNFLYNESMINFHDILATVEKEMSLTDSQVRRAKTLTNVIYSIFSRLLKDDFEDSQNSLNNIKMIKERSDEESDEFDSYTPPQSSSYGSNSNEQRTEQKSDSRSDENSSRMMAPQSSGSSSDKQNRGQIGRPMKRESDVSESEEGRSLLNDPQKTLDSGDSQLKNFKKGK